MANTIARVGNNLPNGNFIPEIWSKKLLAKFYRQTCLMEICNTNWEGEIKAQGNKVLIRSRPTITIGDYIVNGKISYQDLVDDKIELLIDRAKYFAFKADDIDAAQADIPFMNEAQQDAAQQMQIYIDTHVLGTVYADSTNGITSTAVTKSTVLDWLVDAGTKLDEKNIPTDGRWAIIPPWVAGTIKKSDLQDASLSGDNTSILRNGRLGMIDRFTLYVSNCLATNGTTWQAMAGHKAAITFASQIVKVEPVQMVDTFGKAIRGLNVYGFKTVIPDALVAMPCTKT